MLIVAFRNIERLVFSWTNFYYINNKKVRGVLLLLLGAFIIIWVVQHQPSDALIYKIHGLFDRTSYSMSEPWYYASLVVGELLALQGLRNFFET